MKKLLVLAIGMVALAIPAAASADSTTDSDFVHNGNTVAETTEVVFTGTAYFDFGNGAVVHCQDTNTVVDLFPNGTGEVTGFD